MRARPGVFFPNPPTHLCRERPRRHKRYGFFFPISFSCVSNPFIPSPSPYHPPSRKNFRTLTLYLPRSSSPPPSTPSRGTYSVVARLFYYRLPPHSHTLPLATTTTAITTTTCYICKNGCIRAQRGLSHFKQLPDGFPAPTQRPLPAGFLFEPRSFRLCHIPLRALSARVHFTTVVSVRQ